MVNGQAKKLLKHIRRLVVAQSTGRLTDGQLLDRFVTSQDQAAFAAMVTRHGAMVLGVCRRVLRNVEDAEDACQAAFLVLARKASAIRKKDSLASWLHGVAFRIAANLKKNGARHRPFTRAQAAVLPTGPAEEVTWREVQVALDEEINRLPKQYRAPVLLCYLEEKTRDEAARELGLSLATLRGRLERGREFLRARLTRRGLTISATLFAVTLGQGSASAGMSPTMAVSLIQAAAAGAGGTAASGAVPAKVAALTQGAIQAMFLTKLKVVSALMVALVLVGGGLGLLAFPGMEGTKASAKEIKELPLEQAAPAALVAEGGLAQEKAVPLEKGLAQDKPPAAAKNISPLLSDGFLQKVSKPLQQIFQFTFEGPNLMIDRKGWERAAQDAPKVRWFANNMGPGPPVEQLFYQIQAAAGQSGSTAGVSGRERGVNFYGDSLSASLSIRGEAVHMVLHEIQTPERRLEFSDTSPGCFRLQVTHPSGDMILLNQMRGGRFTAVALVGGHMFTGQGESFVKAFRQHRQEMETHILPVLEQFGIRPILSPQTPNVRQAVLAQVLRTPETLAEGRKLLIDLNSEKFAVRDKASRALSDRFALYKDLIQEKLQEKGIALELQTRLQNILATNADSLRVDQTVAALNLLQDAGYLVALLDHVAPDETPRLIRYLEKTTGQNLGPDPAAWKAWARKSQK